MGMTLEELEKFHADPTNAEAIDVEFEEDDDDDNGGSLYMALTYLESAQLLFEEIIYPKARGRAITREEAKNVAALSVEINAFLRGFNQSTQEDEEEEGV
jgi:hypothetical protein